MQAHAIPSFILVGLIAKHASFLSKSSRRKQSSKLLNVNQSSLWWKFQSENFAASLNLSHFSIHSVKLLSHNPIPRSKKCQTSIYFHLDNFSIFMESISSQIKLPPYGTSHSRLWTFARVVAAASWGWESICYCVKISIAAAFCSKQFIFTSHCSFNPEVLEKKIDKFPAWICFIAI